MRAPDLGKSGIEDINVGTYPGEEVAVHVSSSRPFNHKQLIVLSTCSTPARPWWAKLELRSGPVHRSARLAQATAPQSPPSVRQGHSGTWPVWQGHRRDGSIVTRLKPGHTRNMALGCSTITPTGYARPRLSTERRKRRLRFFGRKTLTVTEKRKRPATGLNVF